MNPVGDLIMHLHNLVLILNRVVKMVRCVESPSLLSLCSVECLCQSIIVVV